MASSPSIGGELWQKAIEWIVETLTQYLGISISQDTAVKMLLPFIALLGLPFVKRWLSKGLLMLPIVRRLVDPREGLVGEWIEVISRGKTRYFTLVSIRYNYDQSNYEIVGIALTEQGVEYAEFSSHIIEFFKETDRVELVYRAVLCQNSRETKGYGTYKFRRKASILERFGYRKFEKEGNGYFVDFQLSEDKPDSEVLQLCTFSFERLDPRLVKYLIKKKRPHNSEDRKSLAINYQNYKIKRDSSITQTHEAQT